MFVILNLCEEISHNKLKILSSVVKSGFYSDFCPIFVLDFLICRTLYLNGRQSLVLMNFDIQL